MSLLFSFLDSDLATQREAGHVNLYSLTVSQNGIPDQLTCIPL
jgi:hypothetical protein